MPHRGREDGYWSAPRKPYAAWCWIACLRKAEPVVDKYSAEDLQNAGRLKQIRMAAGLVNQRDKKALPITIGSGVAVIAVVVVVGLLTGLAAFLIPLVVLAGLVTIMLIFGRYFPTSQYSAIEGQP